MLFKQFPLALCLVSQFFIHSLSTSEAGKQVAPVLDPAVSSGAIPVADRGSDNSAIIRFTSVKDGQVMTVEGDMPAPGVNITAKVWSRSDSQKWMLVRRGDVYLILPQRQHKEWANFLKRTSQRGRDDLPAVTVVMGIDVQNGMITQQVLHGRSNQHWEFKDLNKDGRVLIVSPTRGKCVQAQHPPKTAPSLFQRAKDKVKGVFSSQTKTEEIVIEPRPLLAVDCEEADETQLWRLQSISY